jgi:hypothetical protein
MNWIEMVIVFILGGFFGIIIMSVLLLSKTGELLTKK